PVVEASTAFVEEEDVKITAVELPASDAAPAKIAETPKAPLIKADAEPVRSAPEAKPAPVKTAAVQTLDAVKPILQNFAFKPKASEGKHYVQLGVFSSPENVTKAWKILSAKNKDLALFDHASAEVQARGKTLYRLSAVGFGSVEAANAMCDGIKAKGGSCFARSTANSAPVRLASR
ncbi:MAG: SPOR domain-containing protein, partial [Pseudomonadota bacterium]